MDTLGNCEQKILSKVAFIAMKVTLALIVAVEVATDVLTGKCNAGRQIYGGLLDFSCRPDGIPVVEMLNACETIYLDEDWR